MEKSHPEYGQRVVKDKQEVVDCIRQFNWFYTVLLAFLNQNYLGIGYSVTEIRILYEISQQEGVSAKQLCDFLKLDKSYMSRIIHSLEHNGIICRKVSASDKRANDVFLTDKGREEVTDLIEITNQNIYQLIDTFDTDVCEQICNAMELIFNQFSEIIRGKTW